MGRRPTKPNAIPRLRARKKASGNVFYYYDHGGSPRRYTALGGDYGLAIKKWAEIERAGDDKPREVITFRYVADQYRARVIPGKAPRTQKDNLAELANLVRFFDDPPCPLDAIQPKHVRLYLSRRSEIAAVRAAREKALLSHLWNWARGVGYTDKPNPCEGIRAKKSRGRDVYVEDDVFAAIHAVARPCVQDAMDLLYLTGQRPADIVAATEQQIRNDMLHFRQRKTGTPIPMTISERLAEVLERIRQRKRGHRIYNMRLVVSDTGKSVSLAMLQRWFAEARAAAKAGDVQLRDLRAKAGTDKADESGDVRQAQRQLGHSSVVMTEQYIRSRKGAKTTPTR